MASKRTSTRWLGATRTASDSSNGTTASKVSTLSSTRNCVPPGRVTTPADPFADEPAPGMAPSLPGASGVVPALGASTSPTAPLTAEPSVPSAGARSTVSSTSFCAAATAACAAATSPRCCAISDGRSVAAESRLFCAVTRPWRAFSTWTRPAASSTSHPVLRRVQRRLVWPPPAARPGSAPTAGWPPGSRRGSPTEAADDTSEPARLPAAFSAASSLFLRSSAESSSPSPSESDCPRIPDSRPEVSTDALDGLPPDASHASLGLVELVLDVVARVLVEVELLLRAVHRRLVGVDGRARLVLVASRISPAWSVVFCAPVTVVALTSRVSAACCEASWPCCCSSTCRAGASSTVASTSPGGDLLADLDVDGLELAALEEPEVLLGDRGQRARTTRRRWSRSSARRGRSAGRAARTTSCTPRACPRPARWARPSGRRAGAATARGLRDAAVPGARVRARRRSTSVGRLDDGSVSTATGSTVVRGRRRRLDRRAPAGRTATVDSRHRGRRVGLGHAVILHRVTRGVPRRRRVGTGHSPPPDGWNIQASSGALDHGWCP